jgi:hypothetical protein
MTKRCSAVLTALAVVAVAMPAIASDTDWVAKSNENAQIVLELTAEFNPENAGSFGVDGIDEDIIDFRPGLYERNQGAAEAVLAELRKRQAAETDRKVHQDLGILIKAVEDGMRSARLNRDHMLPYFNVSQTVFMGVRNLVDPQIARERYPAAIERMKKYAGLVGAEKPLTELAMDRSKERFGIEGLVGPYRGEVLQDIERSESVGAGGHRPRRLGKALRDSCRPAS